MFAMTKRDGNYQIYTMDPNGSNQTNVTKSSDEESGASWSPDGSRMVFQAGNEIYVMDADGSNLERLTNNGAVDGVPRW